MPAKKNRKKKKSWAERGRWEEEKEEEEGLKEGADLSDKSFWVIN